MDFQTPMLHAESPTQAQKGICHLVGEVERRQVKKDGLLTMAGVRFPFLSYLSTEWSLL